MKTHFLAPWDTKLKTATAVILGVILLVYFQAEATGKLLLLGVVLLCAAFAVRGYSVADGKLRVHRLGWSKSFDLSKLTGAEVSPGVTMGSLRVWGIGGLFGFIGRFHNNALGSYRAYATDADRAVVLDFSGEKVVVTPDSPVEFMRAVLEQQMPARAS
jgi:hypothetical protein